MLTLRSVAGAQRHVVAADQDRARRWRLEPRDHAQRRGLAAAGRAEQRDERARLDVNDTSSTAVTSP